MRSTRTRRPKWARSLPARLWKHLREMQATSTPTLRQLTADVEHQGRTGLTCWECRAALRMAQEPTR